MSFVGIDAVTYGVANMATARRFFTDWGLRRVSSGKTRTVFETSAKCQVILRPRGTKGLPKAIQRGSTIRELVWGVSSKREVNAIGSVLWTVPSLSMVTSRSFASSFAMALTSRFDDTPQTGSRRALRRRISPVSTVVTFPAS